jgi:sulfhydrogenase subunit beta (sulfur reductase)
MLPKIIKKGNLKAFVEALMEHNSVVAPMKKDSQYAFAEVDRFEDIALTYETTLLSPKKYFFPQEEVVLKYKTGTQPTAESVVAVEPRTRIIFGIHPFDIAATWLLDVVFSKNPADPNYMEKRKRAILVGYNCGQPCDKFSFCRDMGTYKAESGYDLMLTDLGDRYFVEIGSPEGEALLTESADYEEASGDDLKALQKFTEEKETRFVKRIPYDTKFLPEILEASYDSLVWEAIGRRCFSCGACNTTCPTCYCFDIKDEVTTDLNAGVRKRCWDSCQLREFAQVAGGENFRKDRSARLRHRFMRKGKWILERYGKLGCVGCGRCDRNCLAKINSVEVYTQLAGDRKK